MGLPTKQGVGCSNHPGRIHSFNNFRFSPFSFGYHFVVDAPKRSLLLGLARAERCNRAQTGTLRGQPRRILVFRTEFPEFPA
jgi:hypothetical protein